MRRRVLLRLVALTPLLVLPTLALQLPQVRAALTALVTAMRGGGITGLAIYALSYAIGGVLTAPVAVMSGLAGYAYGPTRGLLAASPICVASAVLTFLTGKLLLRRPIQRRLAVDDRFRAIDRAVALNALRITLLLRLTPIMPQNLLSYALSATSARLPAFAAGTWLGLLPVTCLHVYLGSLVRDVAEIVAGVRPTGPLTWIVPSVGLALTVVVVALTSRFAKKALAQALAVDESAVVASD